MSQSPAATPSVPSLVLNNGVRMPQLGFGVFLIPPVEAAGAVRTAIEAGYRLIDTAAAYGNEESVGRAVAQSGVPREDLFITTKVQNGDQGFQKTLKAFDRSRSRLGLDAIDLYLIHWPMPARDEYVDTWRALEKIYERGAARAIGVSNFNVDHVERLFAETTVQPAVNQIELHPGLPQADLRAFHDKHHIATEAWSPIGRGRGILEHPAIVAVAEAHGVSPAQAVLRWHVHLGNVAIPKSVTPERIAANIDVFGFDLSDEEMESLTSIGANQRLGPDPELFNG